MKGRQPPDDAPEHRVRFDLSNVSERTDDLDYDSDSLPTSDPDIDDDDADVVHDLLEFDTHVYHRPASTLIDGGAKGDFITHQYVRRRRLRTKRAKFRYITLPDNHVYASTHVVPNALIRLPDGTVVRRTLRVIPLKTFDVILGKPFLNDTNPDIDWPTNRVSFKTPSGHLCSFTATATSHHARDAQLNLLSAQQARRIINRAARSRRAQKDTVVGLIKLRQIFSSDESTSSTLNTTDTTSTPDIDADIRAVLDEFSDVFVDELPNELPPKRDVDHAIELEEGARPWSQQPYRMSLAEKQELLRQLKQLLAAGLIRPSKSPWGAPVLLVKKPRSTALRLCIDWRRLNSMTKKNRTLIPRIDDLIDEVGDAEFFTCLDLRSAYNQLRLRPGDEEKTAFRTCFGHFEFTVVSFGLCNAPGSFQTLMFNIFRPFLGRFVCCYLDDVMIYSRTRAEHVQHIKHVLTVLRENKLYGNLEKSMFARSEVRYLGHIIMRGGKVKPDPDNIASVQNWPRPLNRKQMQGFLGLANFHRRFIDHFSDVAKPLTNLTKSSVKYLWTEDAETAFQELKKRLTSAPVLRIFDPARKTRIVADASKFALGACLQQLQDDGEYHPVSFYSRTFNDAERNYPIRQQELLALIASLRQWRHYLYGTEMTITLCTDHRTLTSIPTQKDVHGRLARWMETLSEFNVKIVYIEGATNVVADALSRSPLVTPDDLISLNRLDFIDFSDWTTRFIQATKDDAHAQSILKLFRDQPNSARSRHYSINPDSGLIQFQDHRMYVPASLRPALLTEAHDRSGHFGFDKIYLMLQKTFYWPKMDRSIRKFVKTCETCLRVKSNRGKPAGLLQPLEIAQFPFDSVSMDFIMELPRTRNGFDAIMVVVCRFAKLALFIPCHNTTTATQAAQLYFSVVRRRYGLPRSIVSDRDPRFVANFWKELTRLLNIKLKMSSTDHPQSDGQTEITNRILEEMLRSVVNYTQDDWDECLPDIEFNYNSAPSISTGMSPFEIVHSFTPRSPLLLAADALKTELERSRVPAASSLCSDIMTRHALVRDRLIEAQQRQVKFADRKRRDVTFKVGDQVLVSTKTLTLDIDKQRPKKKLRDTYTGPFRVIARIGKSQSYRVDLPPSSKAHPVFHVSRLRPYHVRPHSNAPRPDPTVVAAPTAPAEQRVERILDWRLHRGRHQYLVHWYDHPPSDSSWVSAAVVAQCPELLADFQRTYNARTHHPRGRRRSSRLAASVPH